MILFKPKLHVQHFSFFLKQKLPGSSVDSTRITIAYFVLSGLDVLNRIEMIDKQRTAYIKWLYHLLCRQENVMGFQNFATFNNISSYASSHIAGTYSALNSLLILEDDLAGIDKVNLLKSLKLLQLKDGSYVGAYSGTENDMRFVYCAACISFILDDWSGMDVAKVVEFILNSISYDGGIGQGPHLESHGGSTYCAIATLALTGNLHRLSGAQMARLVRWLLHLQAGGFKGRPNKDEDTCYTFWVGATLKILNNYHLINRKQLRNFVLSAQDFRIGGFSKLPECEADPLHTYFSLAGLSLMQFEGLNEIVPTLNITHRAYAHLMRLHEQWKCDINTNGSVT